MTDTPQVPSYGVPGAPGPNVTAPAVEPPKMTTWQRLANIFLSPGEVFEDINRKPDFILPLILTTVLSLGFYMIVNWQLKLDPYEVAKAGVEKQLEAQGKRMRDLSENERQAYEQGIELSVKFQKYALVLVLVIIPLGITFFAGVYYIGSLLIRGQTSFVKVLSVISYATFVTDLVKGLLTVLIVAIRPPDMDAILQQNLVASNLTILASRGTPQWLFTLFQQFDFFTIWFISLITIGLAAICYKKKPLQIAWLPFGLWVIWIVVRVALAFIFTGGK